MDFLKIVFKKFIFKSSNFFENFLFFIFVVFIHFQVSEDNPYSWNKVFVEFFIFFAPSLYFYVFFAA